MKKELCEKFSGFVARISTQSFKDHGSEKYSPFDDQTLMMPLDKNTKRIAEVISY